MYDPDDPVLIECAVKSGLAEICDPTLLRFYMTKLMHRGWAGCFDPVEKRYTQMVRKAKGTGQSEEQLAAMRNRLLTYRANASASTERLNDTKPENACGQKAGSTEVVLQFEAISSEEELG